MKVLHFFKTYWPDSFGGVERTIHAIAEGTAKWGIGSDVLSLSKAPEENSRAFDGHNAYKAKLDFEFASTGFSRDVFRRFRELAGRADIVHYHFPWPAMDVVHLSSGLKKPTVVTYHSDIVKQRILLQFYKPVMHSFLRSVDVIVATSPNYAATSEVLQRYRAKTQIIPLGLDEGNYPRAPEDVKAYWRRRFPKPFFLFVGVLRYYKGLHTLLKASREMSIDVVLIGEGPMESWLKTYSKDHRLDNIHFLGFLPDTDKSALLELSTAFVFPSHLRSEAFGLSLVEAAMFGKPMISCDIGTGTSFVNIDGRTGLVVPPNDPTALAGAMTCLATNADLARKFGHGARSRYLEFLTVDAMATAYVSIYNRLGGKDKKPPDLK
jgi:rhamnosyl/mannosyltransferase